MPCKAKKGKAKQSKVKQRKVCNMCCFRALARIKEVCMISLSECVCVWILYRALKSEGKKMKIEKQKLG